MKMKISYISKLFFLEILFEFEGHIDAIIMNFFCNNVIITNGPTPP
jgi:hypothetical protein